MNVNPDKTNMAQSLEKIVDLLMKWQRMLIKNKYFQ